MRCLKDMIPEAGGVTITFHINVSRNISRKESNHDKSLCASQRQEGKYQDQTRLPQNSKRNALIKIIFDSSSDLAILRFRLDLYRKTH